MLHTATFLCPYAFNYHYKKRVGHFRKTVAITNRSFYTKNNISKHIYVHYDDGPLADMTKAEICVYLGVTVPLPIISVSTKMIVDQWSTATRFASCSETPSIIYGSGSSFYEYNTRNTALLLNEEEEEDLPVNAS